ncbi:CoA-binding protein [Desulfobaculum bizertense]|uniref:CoA-binding domain-containing protein n=1 Tax=Desulfobaculum bizertense DSM 18034 TaxID=1121442 RepID=A0A1T4VNP8_9BACT|nr:CoA-binding protein [Desulfobaculum bizertense]UIJ38146.1 CoA-binding protein [Desulfobaculum bizertense]SKA66566.1 hypothetical protein SAMN02745702_00621 [Desulfobaculum bizertense DSM 18034]
MLLSDDTVRELLAKVNTIAIIGAKDVEGQPVNMVGRYLIDAGFTVIPVHPKRKNVWGLTTYQSITDIPERIDCVDVFRAPAYCPGHAKECLALSEAPLLFWMQSGISSLEAQTLLNQTSTAVVEDRCLMVEHRRLFG